MATSGSGSGGSQLFVRQSTGLVREASALDATIFNAVFSAPVGAALAFGLFWAYSAFPKADLVAATLISFVLNVPVLIMMALLAASMPRTGGDYVWVSRILSPPLALISNFGAALSAMIGATFWARYFAVSALGPVLVSIGAVTGNDTLVEWGRNFSDQKDHQLWVFLGGFSMIALMTAILIAGTKTTFRWQNTFFVIAMTGTLAAFVVLLFGNNADFQAHFNAFNGKFGGGTAADVIGDKAGISPDVGDLGSTIPAIFVVMTFMMWNWWSVYLSGELKSAMNRGRQLSIMFGALIFDVVFIALGAILFFRVVGFDFVVAANSGSDAYAVPSGAFFQLLASLVADIPVLTVLDRRVVPVLEPAGDGRQHVHADPVRVRLGVRSAAAREACRGERADPLAGSGDPAGHGHRHRDAGLVDRDRPTSVRGWRSACWPASSASSSSPSQHSSSRAGARTSTRLRRPT